MKVWLDTEFLDDGRTIDLISIGMVREDGKEYYAINAQMPWVRAINNEWLEANVIPHLPKTKHGVSLDHTHPDVRPHHVIKNEVEEFLLDSSIEGGLELWSWYAAYDHVALAQLWGPMSKMPSFIPMYTNDIRQEFQRHGNPAVPGHLTQDHMPNAHNALVDAKYHKRLHEYISAVGRERYKEAVLEAMHPEVGYWCHLDNLHQGKR